MPRASRILGNTEAVRRVLKPGQAPTMEELRPRVERLRKQIVGKQKLYMTLVMMERAGEIGTVGRGKHRRYVLTRQAARHRDRHRHPGARRGDQVR